MQSYLQLFILLPLAAFLISLCIPKNNEGVLSGIVIGTLGIQLLGTLCFTGYWLFKGYPTLDIKHIVLFKAGNIEIFIDFFFDVVTAVFAIIGAILSYLVAIFSRYYLHRDPGFKRYFCSMILFFMAYMLVVFSGNFETLFIGWEILGICSFLLIAFYRDRYLPVKNSLKVISYYRFGDICLILAMWMSHHLWHENITFLKLNDLQLVTAHLQDHEWYAFFIALMIIISASVKSAQIPFSSWLPRAMEGPTTSSAIFYGSLSVHLGAFMLLRTFPYWQSIVIIKILVIGTGAVTGLVATSIARVQSSVKTQIAYSSIAQIGLIFIEIALGFHVLALIHFAGNAFLRTYQLLVSPSVLGYLVHDQFFNFIPKINSNKKSFSTKIKNTVYLLGIKEWNLDNILYRVFWNPFKWVGKHLGFFSGKPAMAVLAGVFLYGVFADLYKEKVPAGVLEFLPFVFSFIGLMFILKAFASRGNAIYAWFFVVAGQLNIALSTTILNKDFGQNLILLYLGGSIVSAFIGFVCLKKVSAIDNDIQLDQFHGYIYEKPVLGFIFLLACLGLVGLPFTPTFIGIDILFSHIHKHEFLLIIFTALSFVFIELSILRIYARIFLGQHKKVYHPVAYRSS